MTTPKDRATKDDIGDVKTEIANLHADLHRTAWMMGVGIATLMLAGFVVTIVLTRFLA